MDRGTGPETGCTATLLDEIDDYDTIHIYNSGTDIQQLYGCILEGFFKRNRRDAFCQPESLGHA